MSNAANNNSTNIGGVGSPALLVDLNVYNEILSHMRDTVDSLVFDSSPLDSVDEVNGTETTNILFDNWNLLVGAGGTTDQYRNFYLNIVDKYLTETGTSLEELDEEAAGTLNTKMGPQVAGTSLAAASMSGSKPKAKTFASDKEAAEYLDQQFELLCDDDDTNDEEAIANINACLMGYLCIVQDGNDSYVAYDKEKIENTLAWLKPDGLAYQLFNSIDEQIYANEDKGVAVPAAITKLGLGGKLENTLLQVRKDGAGVRLEVTSNNDWLPGKEIDKEPVAYACTEESAKNYFMTNGEYDWNAIENWFALKDDFDDAYHYTSDEYTVLANEMRNMTDDEINSLLDCQEATQRYGSVTRFWILSERHSMQMEQLRAMGATGVEFENQSTRAVLVKTIADRLVQEKVDGVLVETHYKIDSSYNTYKDNIIGNSGVVYGDKQYTAQIEYHADGCTYFKDFTVYPYCESQEIDENMKTSSNSMIYNVMPDVNLAEDGVKTAFKKSLEYVIKEVGMSTPYGVISLAASEITSLQKEYEMKLMAEGVQNALEYGTDAQCMRIQGSAVWVTTDYGYETYVYNPQYDDKELVYSVEAYNRAVYNSLPEEERADFKPYTIQDMKNEFEKKLEDEDYSGSFDQYRDWYVRYGHDEIFEVVRKTDGELGGKESVDEMSYTDLEKYYEEKWDKEISELGDE